MTHTPTSLRSAFSTLAIAASLCAVFGLTPRAAAVAQEAPAPADVVQRYVEQVLDQGRHDLLGELVAADKVDGFRKSLELRRTLFPDLHYRVEEIVSEAGRVVVRCRVTGHHAGGDREELSTGERIPPSGNWLELEEALFYTVEDGKITRGEIVSDQLQVAKALGFTVVPPEGYEKVDRHEPQ